MKFGPHENWTRGSKFHRKCYEIWTRGSIFHSEIWTRVMKKCPTPGPNFITSKLWYMDPGHNFIKIGPVGLIFMGSIFHMTLDHNLIRHTTALCKIWKEGSLAPLYFTTTKKVRFLDATKCFSTHRKFYPNPRIFILILWNSPWIGYLDCVCRNPDSRHCTTSAFIFTFYVMARIVYRKCLKLTMLQCNICRNYDAGNYLYIYLCLLNCFYRKLPNWVLHTLDICLKNTCFLNPYV